MLPNEGESAVHSAILSRVRRILQRTFGVEDELTIARHELRDGASTFGFLLERSAQIIEALAVEDAKGEQRRNEPLDPDVQLGSGSLETIAGVGKDGVDIPIEAERQEIGRCADAPAKLSAEIGELLGRALGMGLRMHNTETLRYGLLRGP